MIGGIGIESKGFFSNTNRPMTTSRLRLLVKFKEYVFGITLQQFLDVVEVRNGCSGYFNSYGQKLSGCNLLSSFVERIAYHALEIPF